MVVAEVQVPTGKRKLTLIMAGRGRGHSPSPYRREIGSFEQGCGSHSPYKKERVSDDHVASPSNGHDHSISPYKRDKSPENGRVPRTNSGRVRANAEIGGEPSPNSLPDTCDSPNYGGPDSPMNDRYNSHSPQVEE